MDEGDLRHELEVTLHARQEVGPALEPELIEGFVDKIDAEIDRRVDARLAQQRRPHRSPSLAVPLGSLGIAIPLIGAAGGTAGLGGVLVVCIAIVLVNAFYYLSTR